MANGLAASEPRIRLFWAKVQKTDSCWIWTGYRFDAGYGGVRIDGVLRRAHRVAFEIVKGPIPDGHELDHLCRNRACVNPDHLEAVTHQVNTLRSAGPSAEAARKTHCKWGHPLAGDNLVPHPEYRRCRTCNTRFARESRRRVEARKAVANG